MRLAIAFLILLSIIVLFSVAPTLFPLYFIYIFIGVICFFIFSRINLETLSYFSKHLYVASIIFLLIPLIIGQVTRGVIRWIPIGGVTIQPSELVRSFLLLFFANYLVGGKFSKKKIIYSLVLLAIPALLILVQPSLGVAVLTVVGYIGVLIATEIDKKALLFIALFLILIFPAFIFFLAPYQRSRVESFLFPGRDPSGAGYNSIQSMIAVGSGELWGRGLGKGVQTQLSFLPERQTDFIFASVSEELGFVGAFLVLFALFFILYSIQKIISNARSPVARAFVSGVFLSLFAQILIHIGMNMGLFPITGIPLPLVSAGGSSFVATMTALGMVLGAKRQA